MRKLIAAALLSIFFTFVCSAQSKPGGEKDMLLGAVQMITTESAIIANGREVWRKVHSIQSFDNLGNIVESILQNADGAASKRSVFLYNAQAPRREEVTYDSKNAISSRTVSTYDPATRKVEVITADDKNALQTKAIYSYDEAGKLTATLAVGENAFEGRTTFSYASDGRLSEETHYNKNNEVENKTSYKYELDSRRIERADYKANGTIEDLVVIVRNFKKRTKEVSYYRADGALAWKILVTYDDKDNVIDEEFANQEALHKFSYEYEVDSAGNWVKRKTSRWLLVSGKPAPVPVLTEVRYRKIAYYSKPYAPMKDALPALYPKDQNGGAVDGVVLGDVIESANIDYPRTTVWANKQSPTRVEVLVDKEGKVESAIAVSGPETLRTAAVEAAKKWRFKPALLNGFPVKATRPVSFSISIVAIRR